MGYLRKPDSASNIVHMGSFPPRSGLERSILMLINVHLSERCDKG